MHNGVNRILGKLSDALQCANQYSESMNFNSQIFCGILFGQNVASVGFLMQENGEMSILI